MLSVVIPAYNEELLITECIRSIKQSLKSIKYEIIVVDNGSTDNTALLAKEAGAIVLTECRKGITRARQTGFELASYELVAFIDADSILPEDWLNYALPAVEKIDVVAVSGPVVYYELSKSKRIVSFVFYCFAKIFHFWLPMLQGGNFILRKQSLLQAGGFNTNIEFYGEDTDTAVRLSKIGKIVFDLDMWVYTSSRRMNEEGLFVVGCKYILNYFSIWLFGEPWNIKYHDHRTK
jgi:glycosyltransferase involved in cell wall biosynthesis